MNASWCRPKHTPAPRTGKKGPLSRGRSSAIASVSAAAPIKSRQPAMVATGSPSAFTKTKPHENASDAARIETTPDVVGWLARGAVIGN